MFKRSIDMNDHKNCQLRLYYYRENPTKKLKYTIRHKYHTHTDVGAVTSIISPAVILRRVFVSVSMAATKFSMIAFCLKL